MNPYWKKEFFSFCALFFQRFWQLITGQLSLKELAPDEIQVFVLVLLSVSSALVGSFLVLRKMAMLANSLSHTILLGIALSYVIFGSLLGIKALLIAALISGFLTILLTHFFTHVIRLQEEASVGLVFTSLFALGVLLVTLFTRNIHLGIEAVMGNVDGLQWSDLELAFGLFLLCGFCVFLFFKELTLTVFDPQLAKLLGLFPGLCNFLLLVLASITAVGSFRAVGVLLFLALLVGPVLAARLLTTRLKALIGLAALLGICCSFVAVALSRHILSAHGVALSTSGLLTLIIGVCFAICLVVSRFKLRNNIQRKDAEPQRKKSY
jgi:manganese/zinc/iron transport system permease protein